MKREWGFDHESRSRFVRTVFPCVGLGCGHRACGGCVTTPVVIGGATLYLGDCLEILPELVASGPKVDSVITDPPYGMNKDFANDTPFEADRIASRVISWCRIVCGGNILAFWSAQRMGAIDSVFAPKRVMIWNKKFALYAPHNVGYRYEPLVWVSGDAANDKRGDIFEGFPIAFRAQAENESHPTQKPLAVLQEVVSDFTPPDGIVLDPFMGSGTTGVACAQLGRKFIGIEIESKYFDIACKRIEAAYAQGRLFEEPQAEPEQKNLLGDAA